MREPFIGIDLGTTFSAVATVEDGRPHLIPNREGGRLTPSMVGFNQTGARVVGEQARVLASDLPENVAYATKRFLGRRFTPELAEEAKALVTYPLLGGPAGEVRIKLAGKVLPLSQVSAMVLGELKLDAEAHFGRPVTQAVITVPANFDDQQRSATKEAARIAGLEVLRIINEPTAAAVAYGLTSSFKGRALVFDLGGGTFDVSILEVEEGVFVVKATGGDSKLGGEDFDLRIVEWLLAQVDESFRPAVRADPVSMQRLKTAAESAKRVLTDRDEAFITVGELGDHVNGGRFTQVETALTRTFFHTLSEPLSRRCVDVCQKVMSAAALDPKSIDAVLLVGGMTRVPLVRWLVSDFFGKEPVAGVNPDEVVALGAAVHANELGVKGGTSLLIDVAGHSLGVGVLGGKVRRLVAQNTAIPVAAKQTFLPSNSGQRAVKICVYQGESDHADECTKLGELTLNDLAAAQRADVPIEVAFELASDGTLSVRAADLTSGLAEALRIDARPELSASEVDRLAKEQTAYADSETLRDAGRLADAFRRTLDKAEKLGRLLEKSAEESPSPEGSDAVAKVKSLIDIGKAAHKTGDLERMAEVTRMIEKLVGPAR
ncbi:MAG: Hsp70 family protein [Myxococcaceae bacterium]